MGGAAFLSSLNPNPKGVLSGQELTRKFNEIQLSDWIGELTQDYRFEDIKPELEKIKKSTRKIDFRQRINEITKVIKNTLSEKYKSSLRFTDITGLELYDPNYILVGVKVKNDQNFIAKYGAYNPMTVLSEDVIASMTTLEVLEYLNSKYYGFSDISNLAMITMDGVKIPNSVIHSKWLESNGYSIDDNIAVIPVSQIGSGVIERGTWVEGQGIPSPTYALFYNFIEALGSLLASKNLIEETRNLEGIYKFTNEISKKMLDGKDSVATILSAIRSGDQFNIGYDKLVKWNILINGKIKADATLSQTRKNDLTLEVNKVFNDLYSQVGFTNDNPYFKVAYQTLREVVLLFNSEGIINEAETSQFCSVTGFPTSFISNLAEGNRLTPHTFGKITELFETNMKTFLNNYYKTKGLAGDILSRKVNEILEKIGNIVEPYKSLARDHLESEERLLKRGLTENQLEDLTKLPRVNLLSIILHSGGHQLQQINTKDEFGRLLFGSQYIASFTSKANAKRRTDLVTLSRMKFFVSKWQVSDFKNLKHYLTNQPIQISEYELHLLKTDVIKNIDDWIKSNPYKDMNVEGKYYIAESFVKWGKSYVKADLEIDYKLTNDLYLAAMERRFQSYKRDHSVNSITEIPSSEFDFTEKELNNELGIGRRLFSSLSSGQGLPKFYSKRTLQGLLDKLTKWHIDEFGQCDSGLTYVGRPEEKITYDKSDPNIQNLLYYYQNAIYSICDYAEQRGINLNSPANSHIALSESLKSDKELVMNAYQVKVWEHEMTKAYQVIYHLSRYLGFDPISFTPLDDNIFKGGEKAGGYKRHHFLALMFRQMSSHVDDVVLTSDDFHISEYETPLRREGIDMEIYIKQIMKSLVQLIEMRDANGNYVKIKEEHIIKILYENLGEVAGEKVLKKWKEQGDFMKSLGEFNDRRLSAFNGDHKQFLIDNYKNAYSAYFSKINKITYSKILATQSNLDYLNAIYGLKLTLRPVSISLESFY